MSEIIINNQTIISGITTVELIELFRPMVRELLKQEREAQRTKVTPVVPPKVSNSLTASRARFADL